MIGANHIGLTIGSWANADLLCHCVSKTKSISIENNTLCWQGQALAEESGISVRNFLRNPRSKTRLLYYWMSDLLFKKNTRHPKSQLPRGKPTRH